jgi:hypothetical protein
MFINQVTVEVTNDYVRNHDFLLFLYEFLNNYIYFPDFFLQFVKSLLIKHAVDMVHGAVLTCCEKCSPNTFRFCSFFGVFFFKGAPP